MRSAAIDQGQNQHTDFIYQPGVHVRATDVRTAFDGQALDADSKPRPTQTEGTHLCYYQWLYQLPAFSLEFVIFKS
ncbi:hypothetical protein K814_0107300 [Pseudomonas fluorescens LMG 5329]|uniref:Uncharacterized protein n=1 Tax=Pseudomonas fluorescens LMG 5329 TaxID=1324332 RepID=A0A0A1Z2U6_PSEFL|nr:hypothetical protein K814_0107300 [Pseudomonas fluorescens LMG 5329]